MSRIISDESFKLEMHILLKKQGIKKKERNRIIEDALKRVMLDRRECRLALESSM